MSQATHRTISSVNSSASRAEESPSEASELLTSANNSSTLAGVARAELGGEEGGRHDRGVVDQYHLEAVDNGTVAPACKTK